MRWSDEDVFTRLSLTSDTGGVGVVLLWASGVALADVDVVDVGVCLQGEDEADEVGSGEQHCDGVHQRSGGNRTVYGPDSQKVSLNQASATW